MEYTVKTLATFRLSLFLSIAVASVAACGPQNEPKSSDPVTREDSVVRESLEVGAGRGTKEERVVVEDPVVKEAPAVKAPPANDSDTRDRTVFDTGWAYLDAAQRAFDKHHWRNLAEAKKYLTMFTKPAHSYEPLLTALDYFAKEGAIDLVIHGLDYPILREGHKRLLVVRSRASNLLAHMQIERENVPQRLEKATDALELLKIIVMSSPGDAETGIMYDEIRTSTKAFLENYGCIRFDKESPTVDEIVRKTRTWLGKEQAEPHEPAEQSTP